LKLFYVSLEFQLQKLEVEGLKRLKYSPIIYLQQKGENFFLIIICVYQETLK